MIFSSFSQPARVATKNTSNRMGKYFLIISFSDTVINFHLNLAYQIYCFSHYLKPHYSSNLKKMSAKAGYPRLVVPNFGQLDWLRGLVAVGDSNYSSE